MGNLKDAVRAKFPFGSKIRFRSDASGDEPVVPAPEPEPAVEEAPAEVAPESAPEAEEVKEEEAA